MKTNSVEYMLMEEIMMYVYDKYSKITFVKVDFITRKILKDNRYSVAVIIIRDNIKETSFL
jgi:hypothetical protein